MGGVLPRALRPGQELDPDRQGPRPATSGAAARHAPARSVAVVTALRLPRRGRPVAAAIADAAGEPVALVGHSMGGKIAMVLALRHPEQVERLCVVDVAPVAYSSGREFVGYVRAMRGVDLAALATRADADAALVEAVPNPVVRGLPAAESPSQPRRARVGVAAQPPGHRGRPRRDHGLAGRASLRPPAVRRPGAVGARRTVRARRRRPRRGHVGALPAAAPGDDQGRWALGALRAARVVPRGPSSSFSATEPGR